MVERSVAIREKQNIMGNIGNFKHPSSHSSKIKPLLAADLEATGEVDVNK